ncbi:hypothetical protein [Haliovirga abyssi]|uniref:Uncharacterized protein n=1 Tax=Haliovirga abyssi TaxID=2996794 RepID=A0AAU9DCD4_9FUSO|nr:hypothetical protein [Haliovirga abyssi]BDU50965.1 hypothetical protein HLVA_15340 [Haliovirga abyssi]
MVRFIITKFIFIILSMIFPAFGGVVPGYSIKNRNGINKKNMILSEIIIFALVALIFDLKIAIFVYSIFLSIELLYYLLEKSKIKKIDKIIIISFALLGLLYIFFYFNQKDIINAVELAKKTYISFGISKVAVNEVFAYMSLYGFFIAYFYLFFVVFITYYMLDYKEFKEWKISYYILLGYVVAFIIKYIFKVENIYINNFIMIIKLGYVIYGSKEIYYLLVEKLKSKILSNLLVVMITMFLYSITFYIGGFFSLIDMDSFKKKIINKKDNNKNKEK